MRLEALIALYFRSVPRARCRQQQVCAALPAFERRPPYSRAAGTCRPDLANRSSRCPTRVNNSEQLGDFFYRNQTATQPNATGNDHAQSPNRGTAAAATMQPMRKPNRGCRDLFNRPSSTVFNGRPCDSISISARTVLVKLPVITAVEIPPGKAKRKRANWQAIAETAIMTAMPAIKPCGLAEGFVMTCVLLR